MRALLISILLAAAPVSAAAQTWTLQGCSQYSCHRVVISLLGVVGPYDQLMTLMMTSRYFGPYGGAPFRGYFSFTDPSYLYPAIGLALPGYYGTYFEHDDIITSPPGWRPDGMWVEESFGPVGGAVTDDEIFWDTTALVVTPEPASMLLLTSGMAGIGMIAFRRSRRRRTAT